MEQDSLVPIDALNNELAPVSDEAFGELVAASTSYLPRIQLCASNSSLAKEGIIPVNDYAIIYTGDNASALGKEVDCLVLAWQPLAMRTAGDDIESFTDHTTEEFKRVQAESEEQDSGSMWGFQFLLWLAERKEFCTLFLNSKSSRKEAPNLRKLITKAATLKSRLASNRRYKWQTPVVVPCSTPFDEVPDVEHMRDAARKFKQVIVSETKTEEEVSGQER